MQFSYTSGKNATDSALIIDAMDVLHTGRVDGFCLVSSDSDFTRLATRIREAGLVVYGFGERKTPEPFVDACDKFIYTEILRPEKIAEKDAEKVPVVAVADVRKLQPLVIAAIDANARDDGWAALGGVGSHISKMDPAFDARNYGAKKLSELVRSLNRWKWQPMLLDVCRVETNPVAPPADRPPKCLHPRHPNAGRSCSVPPGRAAQVRPPTSAGTRSRAPQ